VVITVVSKSIAATALSAALATSAWGYQQPTHQVLTQQAAGQSVLATNASILGLLQCNVTTACSIAYVQGLLGQAAIDEDNGVRAVSHFFDAQNGGAPISTTLALNSPAEVALCTILVIDAGFSGAILRRSQGLSVQRTGLLTGLRRQMQCFKLLRSELARIRCWSQPRLAVGQRRHPISATTRWRNPIY
jgi:hypothetical protein